jgi:hypothetical protein
MSGCTHDCDQSRRCDCIDFLTPAERRRFWTILAWGCVIDVALVVLILWSSK